MKVRSNIMPERVRVAEAAAITGLANRWFQPLTHVSAPGFPRDRAISCQRGKRETRGAHRFAVIHEVLQSVSGLFRRLEG